ncbi:MAG: DMT family transporter [Paludibacteraceae bacterium]
MATSYIQTHTGEIAALLVAAFWTASALFFEKAGHRVGSLSVNIIRLFLAIVLLGLTTLLTRSMFFPTDANSYQWFWLGISGVIGFFLGDLLLFQSYLVIGSRTAALIMSLAPMLTAIIGWFFLNEILVFKSIVGIIVSVAGVVIAISNKRIKLNIPFKGFLLALGGALGQAGGLVLSKKGMGDFDPIAATQIRAIFGFCCFVIFITALKKWKNVKKALEDKQGVTNISLGAFFGPFIGVALSLYSIQHTKTGIASALMALVPIFIILPSAIMFKEKIKPQQIIGAVVSIIGASIFFL